VWLRGRDVYPVPGNSDSLYINLLSQVGTDALLGAVRVRGTYADGRPAKAIIQGERVYPYSSPRGTTAINLVKGGAGIGISVNYVGFYDLEFRNMGTGCIRTAGTGTRSGITMERIHGNNVRRFIYVSQTTSLDNSKIRYCSAWAANASKTLTLSSSYTVPTTGLYYVVIMVARQRHHRLSALLEAALVTSARLHRIRFGATRPTQD
jgi:hypothetical protein